MENLDSTVLATALPTIARDFGVSPIHLKFALTSYLISIAVFLPASGWLADRFGARTIFRLAILLFTFGSILSGFSTSLETIVGSRIVQGIGGAMMVPVGRLVILKSVPKHELVGSLAWLTIPALIGPIVGPPVGGFVTTYLDWRWVFWINIPFGIAGIVLATIHIPNLYGEDRVRFDALGFLLSAVGLTAMMMGTTTFGLGLIARWQTILLIVIGLVLLVAYCDHARRVEHPIIDLRLFAIPTFRLATIGGLLLRIGIGATPFLLPLLLQLGFGMTAVASGSITFATALGSVIMKFVAQPILHRYGFRRVLIINGFISSAFVAVPIAFSASTPAVVMIGLLLVGGFFRSLQFTSVTALQYADVPRPDMSRATTIASVMQQLSLSFGISIGAIALELSVGPSGTIEAHSFRVPFLVIAVISLASVIPFLRLSRDAADELSGRKPAPDPVTSMRERG